MKTSSDPRNRRTICVLGGTGFVGSYLVARLANAGYAVKVLTRNRQRHRDLLVLPTVSIVQTPVHEPSVLTRELHGCDAAINLVGILNESGRDGSGFRRVHVDLTRKLVGACRASGVRRLLQMSALKADAVNGPSHYLRSKGEAEAVLRDAATEDLAITIMQPSVIFGPGDSFVNRFAGLLALPAPVFPLPRPNARFAPVYVGDVAESFLRALSDPRTSGKSYQLCGPRVYSMREIINYIAAVTGKRPRVIGMSDSIARMFARIGDFLPGKPFSMDNYRSLTVHSLCDSNGLGQLGIAATSLESVVPRYLRDESSQQRFDRYRRAAR